MRETREFLTARSVNCAACESCGYRPRPDETVVMMGGQSVYCDQQCARMDRGRRLDARRVHLVATAQMARACGLLAGDLGCGVGVAGDILESAMESEGFNG